MPSLTAIAAIVLADHARDDGDLVLGTLLVLKLLFALENLLYHARCCL